MNIKSCKSNNNLIPLKKNQKDKIFQDKALLLQIRENLKLILQKTTNPLIKKFKI